MEDVRIRKLNAFFRDTFGRKVHKVGLRGGFSCPNRDGTFSTGGCSFCNPHSSRPATFRTGADVLRQLEEGSRYIAGRYGVSAFLPYFQDYTTTYGDVSTLRRLYSSVLSHPGVVGLSLCTRPDCLSGPVMELLEELSRKTFLWVELGVQTSDERLLLDMNRCHGAKESGDAFRLLHRRGILTGAHMILGYPGSSGRTVMDDAEFLRECGTAGVKLQNFHVVRDTAMESRYRNGEFRTMDMREYVDSVILFLEHTHPGVVIMRLSGQAPADLTVSPRWSLDKSSILKAIRDEMELRDSWQGKALGHSRDALREPPIAADLGSVGTIAGTP